MRRMRRRRRKRGGGEGGRGLVRRMMILSFFLIRIRVLGLRVTDHNKFKEHFFKNELIYNKIFFFFFLN